MIKNVFDAEDPLCHFEILHPWFLDMRGTAARVCNNRVSRKPAKLIWRSARDAPGEPDISTRVFVPPTSQIS